MIEYMLLNDKELGRTLVVIRPPNQKDYEVIRDNKDIEIVREKSIHKIIREWMKYDYHR